MVNEQTAISLAERIEKAVKLHKGLGTPIRFTLNADAGHALAELCRWDAKLITSFTRARETLEAIADLDHETEGPVLARHALRFFDEQSVKTES